GGNIHDMFIAPAGYEHLDALRSAGANSSIGFCAMWFDPALSVVWSDAIKPAIESAGYQAERIDSVEHNDRIDDRIMAMIRKRRFMVADFTGQRGGVYFEAGFALGLGLPVVWTIRESALPDVHFDNRQYNFTLWTDDNLPQFKMRLKNRIEATLGKG